MLLFEACVLGENIMAKTWPGPGHCRVCPGDLGPKPTWQGLSRLGVSEVCIKAPDFGNSHIRCAICHIRFAPYQILYTILRHLMFVNSHTPCTIYHIFNISCIIYHISEPIVGNSQIPRGSGHLQAPPERFEACAPRPRDLAASPARGADLCGPAPGLVWGSGFERQAQNRP